MQVEDKLAIFNQEIKEVTAKKSKSLDYTRLMIWWYVRLLFYPQTLFILTESLINSFAGVKWEK